jgi:hypothetical protein
MGWSKLFSDIVCSSIWNEDDATRIVWVTMIAIKGPNHIVRATVGGLAHQARVSVESCKTAIDKLSNPDPDGMGQPYEGRRIQEVEHGWLVLNGEAYKNRRDETYRQQYQAEWVKAKRIKQKLSTEPVDVDTASTSVDTIRSEQIRADKKEERENGAKAPSLSPSVSLKSPKFEKRPNSWEEFEAYCRKHGCTSTDAQYLYSRWQTSGWKINKQPIESWKHAVQSWKNGGFLPSQKSK